MDNVIELTILALIESLSERHKFDPSDQNLIDTPRRVSESFKELLSGYGQEPEEILKTTFATNDYDQMIVCKDIDFYSLCAHHMLPFFGKIAVGYIPSSYWEGNDHGDTKGKKVVGLSKLARVCQIYARRFQIQERLTQQIADAVWTHLKPIGVGVIVYDVKHLCMIIS